MKPMRIQTFKPLSSKGWFGLLSLLLLTGCGGSSTAEQVCVPGVAQECPCGGVYQECKEDGSGFTSCPCNGIADATESEIGATLSDTGDTTVSGRDRQEETEGETLDAIIATPDSEGEASGDASAGEDGSDSAGDATGNPEDAEEQESDTVDGAASGGGSPAIRRMKKRTQTQAMG